MLFVDENPEVSLCLKPATRRHLSGWLFLGKAHITFKKQGISSSNLYKLCNVFLLMRATTLAPLVWDVLQKPTRKINNVQSPLCHLWFLHASCNYPHWEDQPMVKSVEMLRDLPLTLPYWVGYTISLFGKSISISRRWASDLLW